MSHSVMSIVEKLKPSLNIGSETAELFVPGGLDSYDLVMLITELESVYGISIPGDKMTQEHFESISTIEKLVKELSGAK